jgi:hypothetical protein
VSSPAGDKSKFIRFLSRTEITAGVIAKFLPGAQPQCLLDASQWKKGAAALLEIRDRRLYRAEGYADFGRYCREKLHAGKSAVNRQIAIAEVHKAVASAGAKALPGSERQLRPLLSLRHPGVLATTVATVWAKVVHDAGITKKSAHVGALDAMDPAQARAAVEKVAEKVHAQVKANYR